ncbi:unnamed protein product, partial [Thlaspi arvense]
MLSLSLQILCLLQNLSPFQATKPIYLLVKSSSLVSSSPPQVLVGILEFGTRKSLRELMYGLQTETILFISNRTLKISDNNLVIFDQSDAPVWSTNLTGVDVRSPVKTFTNTEQDTRKYGNCSFTLKRSWANSSTVFTETLSVVQTVFAVPYSTLCVSQKLYFSVVVTTRSDSRTAAYLKLLT